MTRELVRKPDVQRHARAIGVLYVMLFALGPLVFLGGKGAVLVVDDVSATASNVRALGEGYRHGMGIEVLIALIEVVLSGLLYMIFRPVQRAIALAAVLARFGEAVLQGANLMTSALVLSVIGREAELASTRPVVRDTMVYALQHANGVMVLVWGLFFGLHVVLLAWLVYASEFLPRWLGGLLFLAGAGYFLQGFGVLLFPSVASTLDILVVVLAVPGELAFTLWMLFKGVDVRIWRGKANLASVA